MPDPYDYTSAFANLQSPQAAIMEGIKNGVALTDVQALRAQQARDLAVQQQKQATIKALVDNPNATADDYAKATLVVPELHEQFKQAWSTKNTAQQQSDLKRITEWSAAIQSGQPKIASDGMRAQADAIENTAGAPTPESKALRVKADNVDANPQAANVILKSMLAAHPEGKNAIDNIVALGKEQRAVNEAPADLAKKAADAATAGADATIKNLGIVGQTLGSLQGKGAKPEQAKTAIASLVSRGAIKPEDKQSWLDQVPTDPKQLDTWLGQQRAAGMKPDEQQKFATPDANTVANNATSRYTADSTAKTAANRLAFDKEQSADPAPVVSNGLQGQKFLESLDKPTADQVKALAEGRLAFPVGKALQSPYWQKMITSVAQYDPSFDAVNYNARAKTRNDMVAGKGAENIKAINTAIAHMGQLNDQLSGLHNTASPSYNTVANWLGTHLGDTKLQTKLAAADATAEGVAGEMAKVFRSTGMSEHEIDAWRKKFGNSTTPGQQKGTMESAMHMLQGRMEAIQEQYKVGMGTTAQPLQILTPEAQVIFDKLIGDKPKKAATSATPIIPAGWSVEVH